MILHPLPILTSAKIDSDVIIDVKAAYRNAQHARPVSQPYSSAEWEVEVGMVNEFGESFSDDDTMKVDWFAYISNPDSTRSWKGALVPTPRADVLHLLPYEIWGYVLLQRKWRQYSLLLLLSLALLDSKSGPLSPT